MTLDERNIISIVEVVVYLPILAVAFLLGSRHGFGHSSGWLFLITFSLLRIIGAGLQLGELKSPSNVSLYIGAAVCQNIGFSPLLLSTIGLLSRVWESIEKRKPVSIIFYIGHGIQLLIFGALILGIIGGVDAGNNFTSTGKFTYVVESKIAVILFIVAFVLFALLMVYTSILIEYIEAEEKRLLFGIWLSFPLLFIRLLYSCLSNFDKAAKWNTLTGSATLLLCLAVIEEIIIVLIYEICGLALTKRVNKVSIDSADGYQGEAPQQKQERTTLQKIGHFLAHYTIFGLLIGPLFRKSRKSSPKESQMPLNQQELSSA